MSGQQPMRTYVSTEEVILDTLMSIHRTDLKESPIMHRWVEKAEKAISGKYQFEYVNRVIKMDKCKGKLPAGTSKVMAVVLGDKGEECDVVFNYACGVNVTFDLTSQDFGNGVVIIPGSSTSVRMPLNYFVQDGFIIFDKDMDGDYITTRLQVFKTDERGAIMVQESHLEAIEYFIKYKLAEGRFAYDKGDINYFRRLWNQHCRNARAMSSAASESEIEQASNMYNNPLSGRAIEIVDYHGEY